MQIISVLLIVSLIFSGLVFIAGVVRSRRDLMKIEKSGRWGR